MGLRFEGRPWSRIRSLMAPRSSISMRIGESGSPGLSITLNITTSPRKDKEWMTCNVKESKSYLSLQIPNWCKLGGCRDTQGRGSGQRSSWTRSSSLSAGNGESGDPFASWFDWESRSGWCVPDSDRDSVQREVCTRTRAFVTPEKSSGHAWTWTWTWTWAQWQSRRSTGLLRADWTWALGLWRMTWVFALA